MNRAPRAVRSLSIILALLLILILSIAVTSAQPQPGSAAEAAASGASAQGQVAGGIAQLQQDTGGTVEISRSDATGVVSFVRFTDPAALNLNQSDALVAGNPGAQSAAFFAQYGAVFGVSDPARELELVASNDTGQGLSSLTYQQRYKGRDVFAGVLKSHFDRFGQLTAVNGAFIPGLDLSVVPNRSPEAAASVAVSEVAGQKGAADLAAAGSRLVVYRTGLARGVQGTNHLAYEVEVTNSAISIREFVFVDAHTGKVIDQITGIYHALDREVSEQSLGNVIWDESAGHPYPIPGGWAGGSAQQVLDWNNEIDGASESYYVFASMTGGAYLSYDSADATMRTVNNDPGISCPNANWNGTSTNYCSGVTGDDTVAHEWGHAYTEYTNNLIYQWQSGALNESYSDIWGEVVDFLNGRGTDSPLGLRSAGGCSVYGSGPNNDNSYRWLSGEDDPAFGGAIRDMWNPTCYSDPGKVTDSQYVCSTADSGGVHSNSGVPNHAFALMVDGGSYNGQSVTGIGLTKAAHIHWAAQNMLTPSSNFVDHANALESACSDLTGVNLNAISTTSPSAVPSGEIITSADCAEVSDAIAAVQFRTEPTQCNFTTMLDPNAPALCSAGETVNTIALQDWESGFGSWTAGTRAVANPSTFDTPDWTFVGNLPAGAPAGSTQAAFVADLIIGDCAADDETGVLYMDSPVMNIPAGAAPKLAFDHWVATELGWDGGNLKVSVNGGGWQLVPSAAFTFNAYNSTLNSSGAGNTNPLAGQSAFTGTDGGSVGGSWGQSQVDLSGFAGGDDSVRLRYEFGVDGCNGVVGWYVDNVHTYSCDLPAGEMHVSNIDLVKVSQGPNRAARAFVTVVDDGGNPLGGVTVDGTFDGPTNGTDGADSQVTDGSGVATLNSPREKRANGDFDFCVDNLTFGAWTYTPSEPDCASTAPAVEEGTVTGTVTDDDAQLPNPIIGATVTADTGQSAITDGSGNYTLNNVPAGLRTIGVSASNYSSPPQDTNVTDGGTSTVDFVMTFQTTIDIHVGDLDGSSSSAPRNRWSATVLVTVHTSGEGPVANATVEGLWSGGASGSDSCVTNGAGQCAMTKTNIKGNRSSATFTVTSVSHGSDNYTGANHDPDGDSNGTVITVTKP